MIEVMLYGIGVMIFFTCLMLFGMLAVMAFDMFMRITYGRGR